VKSDRRSLEYGLEEVMRMRPVSYDHHASLFTENGIEVQAEKSRALGFIAQEMYGVVPLVVSRPEDEQKDLWSMNYEKLVPVLVKAIQEQQSLITEQKEVILKQSAMLESHEVRLRDMEARILEQTSQR